MAFSFSPLSPALASNFTRLPIRLNSLLMLSRCHKVSETAQCKSTDSTIVRRDANYGPPIWKDDFMQSLKNIYSEEGYKRRVNELKEEVRLVIEKEEDTLCRLELVDALQRLGVSHHFEDEIKVIFDSIWNTEFHQQQLISKDLYATSLQFRLFRQHAYPIPQEVFNIFKDESGNFKICLCEDIKGMLNLYEASYYSIEGESIMDEARDFTTKRLTDYLINNDRVDTDKSIFQLVSHALELPLHWRMPRLEARWFIDVYQTTNNMNPLLLELAKLDFNIVQAIHQDDLRQSSRWWKSTCWGEKLSFARDRLMENYLWSIGLNYKPQYAYFRRIITKTNAFATTIDDVYDVYGTLDELELFTKVIERWDVNAMEQLPEYMQICFLQLYNSINEIVYDVLKEQGFNILPYLKKAWGDLCKLYLLEAKWYYSGYTPSMEEYMTTSWITVTIPAMLTHSFFLCTNDKTKEALESLEKYANVIQWSGMIVRLLDDLGTSSDELKRGDNPKSIQCYMHETGATEEEAREHVRLLIIETWKKMNKDRVAMDSPFSHSFIEIAVNVARMAHCIYEHNIDGHATQDSYSKRRVLSLVVEPVHI